MLLADVTKDYSASVLEQSGALTIAELANRFQPLVEQGRRELRAEGFGHSRQVIERLVDVRYVGQSCEISVPLARGYRREFDRRHARLYGYSNPARPTEIVNLRVRASGLTDKPKWSYSRPHAERACPSSLKQARFGQRVYRTAFYRWDDLAPGARAAGPSVVTGNEATVVIPPGFRFRVDGFGNVIIRKP